MLEYDNSAFYYFSFTILVLFVVPASIYTFTDVFVAIKGEPKSKARTEFEKDKVKKLAAEASGKKRLTSWPFLIRSALLVLALLSMYYILNLIKDDNQIAQFDPFHILEIEAGADDKTIKKAYRKLSLQYHPDKNLNNKTAEEMFMKVAKAYEALTDEESKKNYEEFGNPDGKQALEVSIGLPTFLMESANSNMIMVIYLVTLVVIIPMLVCIWYANSKQYGEKNVMYRTYNHFMQLLTENHRLKQMPEVLAAAQEFFSINTARLTEKDDLAKLFRTVMGTKQMNKPKHEGVPWLVKGNSLIHAHLLRAKQNFPNALTPKFAKDLELMLEKCPELLDALAELSFQRQWLQTTLSAIRFAQCVYQALWINDHSLMQIPHFTDTVVKHATSGKGKTIKNLSQYLKIPDDQKKGLLGLTPEQQKEARAVMEILPKVQISTRVFVEEDPDAEDQIQGDVVVERDIVTLRVVLTRLHVPETPGAVAPPVHAPFFPRPIKENWWILLTDKEEHIMHAEKTTAQEREITHDIKFMGPETVGTYAYTLHVLPDCYMGLDEEIEVKVVVTAAAIPDYVPHPEDLELDNEPTLFEQVMAANIDDSDSDDEDAQNEANGSTHTADPAVEPDAEGETTDEANTTDES